MKRVVVLGTSGSGKTTLARELARRLAVMHIELDALHWNANWTPSQPDVLRHRIEVALANAAGGWCVCGNYRVANHSIWRQADTFIWLDYPMSTVMTRVLWRTVRRAWFGTELWNGNRERVLVQLFSRDSLLLWVINTWRKRRRDYPKQLREQRDLGKRVIRLRHPAQTAQWLAEIGATVESI